MADEQRYVELQNRSAARQERTAHLEGQMEQAKDVQQAEIDATKERRGLFADTGLAVARAIPGAFEEAFDLIGTLDETIMRKAVDLSHSIGIPDIRLGDNPTTEELEGFFNVFSLSREESAEFPLSSIARPSERGLGEIEGLFPEVERLPGKLAEPITKFVMGFVTGKRALAAAGTLQGGARVVQAGNAAAAGVVSDVTVFDGHEARLSDLIQATEGEGGFPDISNSITAYLASDEEDGELEGRMKSAIEGAGLGIFFDLLLAGVRGVRAARRERAVRAAVDEAEKATVELPAETLTPTRPRVEVDEDNVTSVFVEGGELNAIPRGNETLQVISVEVEGAARGQGKGTELYAEAASQADEAGLRLTSDSSVTEEAARVWESMARKGEDIVDQRVTNPDNVTKEVGVNGEVNYVTNNGTPVFERAAKQADEAQAPKTEAEVIEVQKAETKSRIRETMNITPEQATAFRKAVEDGDDNAAVEILTDFNENTIDWTKIEDAADIKSVLLETERMFADLVTDAKGGVQSNAQTRRLANLVAASGQEIGRLFRDVRGGGGIAARFYAAHRTMLASAEEVRRSARDSLAHPGSSIHEARALRALQVHAAIQAEVKGAQTEIARALQGMSIIKDAQANNFREFDELRRQFSDTSGGKSAWEKHMDDILSSRSLDDLNTKVRRTRGQRLQDIFFEYTINSMLSSPKTHVINLTSNILNAVIYSLDRTLGGTYRTMIAGDKAALREARIDIASKLFRMDEAWQLARKAWADGAPVTDKRQRIEYLQRQAIAVEGTVRDPRAGDETLSELGSPLITRKAEVTHDQLGNIVTVSEFDFFQRAINTLGRVIRVPGRALITGDEFFKAINRNAEINVLSFRKADEEALGKGLEYGTDAYEAFVSKRSSSLANEAQLQTPTSREAAEIQAQAIEKSRLTTFQESARTKLGRATENAVNANQWVKLLIAPFFRTPMNILRQAVWDRTLLGRTLSSTKEALKTAHPREAAEIKARMLTGTAALTAMAFAADGPDGEGSFAIVGTVPRGSSAKQANVQDYSIRLGDTWYQFNRLEPLGLWLGMIADGKTAMTYAREDEDLIFTAIQGSMGAFINNVTSKTFMESLSNLVDLAEGVSSGKPASVERATDRFIAGEFGKLIPQFVKASAAGLEGDDNRYAREAWDVFDTMLVRSSLFHDTEPYKHDALGFPIERDAGLSILLNPFAASRDKLDDPVYKAMFDLGFTLQPVPKTLGGGEVELTSDEYSALTGAMRDTKTYEALTALVTSTAWEDLAPPLQTALMKKLINTGRKAAREIFLGQNPDVVKRATQAQVDAAFLLTSDAE